MNTHMYAMTDISSCMLIDGGFKESNWLCISDLSWFYVIKKGVAQIVLAQVIIMGVHCGVVYGIPLLALFS